MVSLITALLIGANDVEIGIGEQEGKYSGCIYMYEKYRSGPIPVMLVSTEFIYDTEKDARDAMTQTVSEITDEVRQLENDGKGGSSSDIDRFVERFKL